MKPERVWSLQKVAKKEGKIAPAAIRATQAAFLRAKGGGGAVDFVKEGKLVRMLPSGKSKVLGTVAPRVRKERTAYQLVWTPPSRD